MPVDLKTKYLGLPASVPWPSALGTRFAQVRMSDIDGDGRDEVVAFSPDAAGLLSGSLGILSLFDYGAMAPQWKTAPQAQQLMATSLIANSVSSSSRIWQGNIRIKGRSELVVFDGSKTLALWRWFAANEIPGQPGGLVQYSATSPVVYGGPGQPNWTLQSGDRFYIGDVDGDGVDEIVAWNGGGNLALLKSDGSDLRLAWMCSGNAIPGGSGQPSWQLGSSDRFYIGDIDAGGPARIVAFDGTSRLALLRWRQGAGFELFWETVDAIHAMSGNDNWVLRAGDWFHIADIDGNGRSEIIAFNYAANGGTLAGIGWDGSDLRVMGMNTGGSLYKSSSPSEVGWLIDPTQMNYVGPLEKGGRAVIVARETGLGQSGNIGVLRWTGATTAFQVDFNAAQSSGLKLVNPNGLTWTIGSDNGFTFADVDGDGTPELIVQSDSGAGLALVRWNGSQLIPIWTYAAQAAGTRLTGWGMNVIADAPAAAFTPFGTTDQQQIYAQASSSVTSFSNDIRAQYINANNGPSFSGWKSDLDGAVSDLSQDPVMYYWEWMHGYQTADLTTVLTTLQSELTSLLLAYGFWDNMTGASGLLAAVANQRNMDLETVLTNMVVTPPPTATFPYWIGSLIDAALWGIAAVPVEEVGAWPAIGAVFASLFGSFVGAPSSNTPTTTLDYNSLVATINDKDTSQQTKMMGQVLTTLCSDPVKLGMVGPLLEGPWQWDPTSSSIVAAASSPYNRVKFYQLLMPKVFAVWQWVAVPYATPWFYAGPEAWTPTWLYPPLNAFWIFPVGDLNDIYIMAEQSSPISDLLYPSFALTGDLFGTIGISPRTLLSGSFGWNLPSTLMYPDPVNGNKVPEFPPGPVDA